MQRVVDLWRPRITNLYPKQQHAFEKFNFLTRVIYDDRIRLAPCLWLRVQFVRREAAIC